MLQIDFIVLKTEVGKLNIRKLAEVLIGLKNLEKGDD